MKDSAISKSFFYNKIQKVLESRHLIFQFLRYAAIGFLNTALNFLIFNIFSKALNINQGLPLGLVASLAFVAAVVQSYFWNRTWTFGNEAGVSVLENLKRLFLVGLLGLLTLVIIFVASKLSAVWEFYLLPALIYFLFEWFFWKNFGFHKAKFTHPNHSFMTYFGVTFIGLLINAGLVAVISSNLRLTGGDLDKNIAATVATIVSLIWNFTSYKLVVFKQYQTTK